MSQSNQNISKFFPRLNIDVLKVHAARWAAQWPNVPIDRIILYNYASELQKHADEPIKYKKYAVVFEISIVDKLRILTPKGQFRYDFAVASGKITPDHFYEFVKDIEYNTSIDQDKKYKALITEDFTNVYWEKPDDEFRREWVFIPRTLVYDKKEKNLIFEGLPVNVRLAEPNEILFQAENFSKIGISPEDIKDETSEKDPDEFIRDLIVYYENDSEIKIKQPGKEIKSYPYHIVGFRSNQTKEFKTLIKILQNHPHIYHGKLSKDRKILNEIDKKIKIFFFKEFGVEIPSKVKTYYLDREEGRGAYKSKFQIGYDKETKSKLKSKYESFPKNKVLDHLSAMTTEYLKNPKSDYLKPRINIANEVLIEKHKMTEKEIQDFIFQGTDHEEIQKDFSDFRYENNTNDDSEY